PADGETGGGEGSALHVEQRVKRIAAETDMDCAERRGSTGLAVRAATLVANGDGWISYDRAGVVHVEERRGVGAVANVKIAGVAGSSAQVIGTAATVIAEIHFLAELDRSAGLGEGPGGGLDLGGENRSGGQQIGAVRAGDSDEGAAGVHAGERSA